MKIVAKTLLIDAEGNLLLLRRSQTHPYFAHHLDLPGGEVEPGEHNVEAVVREIEEETGLVIRAQDTTLAFENAVDSGLKHLLYTTQLTTVKPAVMLSREHDAYFWMTQSELFDQPVPPGMDSYFQDVLDYLVQQSKAPVDA